MQSKTRQIIVIMAKSVLLLAILSLLVLQSLSKTWVGSKIQHSIAERSSFYDQQRMLFLLRGGKQRKQKKTASFIETLIQKVKSMIRSLFSPNKPSVSVKAKDKAKKAKVVTKVSTTSSAKGTGMDGSSSRLQKEMRSFLEAPPHNCKLTVGKNIRSWTVTLTGVEGTVYAGEEYKLKLNFPQDYPSKPPQVFFLKPVPRHVHVYSNGDICLNLLGRDWSPAMTAEGLVVSILSMLSSAREKGLPQDNSMHAGEAPGKQQDNWMYHDDKC